MLQRPDVAPAASACLAPLGSCGAGALLERGDASVSNDHLVLSSLFFS